MLGMIIIPCNPESEKTGSLGPKPRPSNLIGEPQACERHVSKVILRTVLHLHLHSHMYTHEHDTDTPNTRNKNEVLTLEYEGGVGGNVKEQRRSGEEESKQAHGTSFGSRDNSPCSSQCGP